jgi:hypothetical protein
LGIVLIFFLTGSPEKIARTTSRAEAAASLFERAVFAEPLAADHAALEKHLIGGDSANEAEALLQCGHAAGGAEIFGAVTC